MNADSTRETQRALVIGGSTGVGSGIVTGLTRAGYAVHVLSRTRPRVAHAEWTEVDLNEIGPTEEALSGIAGAGISVMCFSAAVYGAGRKKLVDTPHEEWTEQVNVMMHSLRLALQTCIPSLITAPPGLIIGVSSEVVHNAGPGRSGYAAVKAAASAMLASVRQEYDPADLRVVEVLPQGMVDSPGIRTRRAADFDYSGYASPSAFEPVAEHLGRTRGVSEDGKALVVQPDGTWQALAPTQSPPSQSRPL
jgi:NAD(P)-dependent dehydrogenase (short-subunit alcohol dehydrogenase family)